jgi:AmmeMemoRadiSam system protein B
MIAIIFVSFIFLIIKYDYKLKNSNDKHYSYSEDKSLYGQLDKIKAGFNFDEHIYGGVVSHHLLASIDIAKFYTSLANQEINRVILIGPNHEGQGEENIAVSNLKFSTPWGNLEPDKSSIKNLIMSGAVKIDEDAFVGEHSISVEVPYVKYYLHKASLVPIVIKRNASQEDLLRLVNSLLEISDGKTVIIASVDFSHHTDKLTAELNDKKSLQVISSFDLRNLSGLNIDSPNTIYVLLKYLEGKDARRINYWQQNAADILNSPNYEDVTSYLFAFFRKSI